VPHMGAIIVSLKKEVAKKNNCNFKHITLTWVWQLLIMDDNKCASFLGALTTFKLRNEFKNLFKKVGMHYKWTKKTKRKHIVNIKKWRKIGGESTLLFNVVPLRVLFQGRHLQSPFLFTRRRRTNVIWKKL
jgi:hypothetical protein